MLTVLEVIKKTTDFFAAKGIESPRLNAELLVGHVLALKRMQLYLQFERPLTAAELEAIRPLVRRRGLREPVQYIVGTTDFFGLKLKVDRRALIPRPETERLLEVVTTRQAPAPATILDLAGVDPSAAVDSRSLLPLMTPGNGVATWDEAIVGEFHGHHFPYAQRMLRTRTHKLVVNPESVNELYDLVRDPDELVNVYTLPEYRRVRDGLLRDLYGRLRARGDNFYHWMTSAYPVGDVSYDPSMGGLDDDSYPAQA